MNLKSKKGFTLVELIIVIAILGVIAMIAVPALAGVMTSSRVKADYNSAVKLAETIRIWLTDATIDDAEDRKTAAAAWVDVNSDTLTGLSKLLGGDVTPQGLADAEFYILVSPTTDKIVVAVSKDAPSGNVLTTAYNYGKTADDTVTEGIVYVDGVRIEQDSTPTSTMWE